MAHIRQSNYGAPVAEEGLWMTEQIPSPWRVVATDMACAHQILGDLDQDMPRLSRDLND